MIVIIFYCTFDTFLGYLQVFRVFASATSGPERFRNYHYYGIVLLFRAAVPMQMQAEINSHNFSQSTIKFSLSHCTLVPRASYLGPWAKPLAG